MSVVSESDIQATFCATVVDEWIALGMTHAVICPGSRSTPLALALAARPEVQLHIRLDERSAAFVALGASRALAVPVPILVTSGTAAAELHAAVAEADLSGISLLVVTADRPAELHDVRAPQTLIQHGLFGDAVRAMIDPGVPVASTMAVWRSIAARAWLTARGGVADPGPVHLNLQFREPLVGTPQPLPEGRPHGWRDEVRSSGMASAELHHVLQGTNRVLVVAGAGAPAELGTICAERQWPLLADPRSGLRTAGAVGLADPILRSEAAAAALCPEVIVVVGESWASKVLGQRIASWVRGGATLVHLSGRTALDDPLHLVHLRVACGDGAMVSVLEQCPAASDPSYRTSWLAADAAATAALTDALDGDPAMLNEVVAARLVAAAPFSALVVSSSMPIRDLEWFAPQIVAPMVWSNRGANGIDGVVSTAIGTTFATDGPVAVVVGDLAFLHDLTALVDGLGAEGGSLTVVVVDNGGGGIFSFLPQATAVDPSTFSALFQTARPIDHRAVVTGLGHMAISVTSGDALADALEESAARPGITVIHVPVPAPSSNVSLHDHLNAAVGAAVAAVL